MKRLNTGREKQSNIEIDYNDSTRRRKHDLGRCMVERGLGQCMGKASALLAGLVL